VDFFFFFFFALRAWRGQNRQVLDGYITIANATIYIKSRCYNRPRIRLQKPVYYSVNVALVADVYRAKNLIFGSKNRPYMGARMSYIWTHEWAIHGSKNGPYMEARMSHTWKQE